MLRQTQEVIMASYEYRWMSYLSRPLAVVDTVLQMLGEQVYFSLTHTEVRTR